MAITAVLGILGGLLGAGGSVAGGLLSQPSTGAPGQNPTFNPASDPLTAFATLNALAQFGQFDPSVVQVSSPLQRAIEQLRAEGIAGSVAGDLSGDKRFGRRVIGVQDAFDIVDKARTEGLELPELRTKKLTKKQEKQGKTQGKVLNKGVERRLRELGFTPGQTISAEEAAGLDAETLIMLSGAATEGKGGKALRKAQDVLARSGFAGLDELIEAETQFREGLPDALSPFQETAARNQEQARAVQDRLFEIATGGGLNLEQLRQDELERARVFQDDFRQQAIREANAGGFNPAAALERSALLEETGQNEALGRAIQLLSGQTTEVGLLQALDPTRFGQALQPALAASRNPLSTGSPQQPGPPIPNALGAGLAGAGQQLGQATSNLALMNLLNSGGGSGPASTSQGLGGTAAQNFAFGNLFGGAGPAT